MAQTLLPLKGIFGGKKANTMIGTYKVLPDGAEQSRFQTSAVTSKLGLDTCRPCSAPMTPTNRPCIKVHVNLTIPDSHFAISIGRIKPG
jgi:hypothetical protein